MFNAHSAVEIFVRSGSQELSSHGSGYRIGGRLVLTCAHILGQRQKLVNITVRPATGDAIGARLVWRSIKADVAILEENPADEAVQTAVLGQLPRALGGETVDFVMIGWPRAGETSSASQVL